MMEIFADPAGAGFALPENRVYRGDGVGTSWFFDHLQDSRDEPVRTETLLRQGTVWAGVNIIAGDVGQIPFRVMRKAGDRMEEDLSHPVTGLMANGPNSWQTTDQWLEWMTATAIIWGNAVSYIRKNQRGQIVALEPIPPIYIDWNVENGEPYYYLTAADDIGKIIFPHEVIHIKTISTTGFWGLRLAEVAFNELTLEKAAKRHAAKVFANGAFPAGVLQHPGKLSREAREQLREGWEQAHGGKNSGRPAVLWEGMTYNPITVTPADSQLLEMVSHDATLIGRLLQISPFMLGDLRHAATRANVEEEFKQYYNRTLRRRVNALANEMTRKLTVRLDTRIVPDPTEILKGDLHTQIELAGMAVKDRIWNRNEARAYVGYNPVEGGDEFTNPAIDVAQPAEGPDTDESQRPAAMAAARRIRAIEGRRLADAARKRRDFLSFIEWFYEKELPRVVASEWPGASVAAGYCDARRRLMLLYSEAKTTEEVAARIEEEPQDADVLAIAAYLEEPAE